MIVITRNKLNILNFDHVTEMFLSPDKMSIRVNFSNGGRYELERYNELGQAQRAMEMLCEAIGTVEKFILPTEEQIKAYVVKTTNRATPKHITGKKNKGHGGS